jgi:hypothetical protein
VLFPILQPRFLQRSLRYKIDKKRENRFDPLTDGHMSMCLALHLLF